MKRFAKLVWYLSGVFVLALALLAVSCNGSSTTPQEEEKPATQQVPAVEGSDVQETVVEEGEAEETEETGESETPDAIPHTLEGRDNCLMCHSETGPVPFPASHAGRTNDTCTDCHQPSQSEESSSGTEASSGPPAIPHTLAGRDNCLMCHSETGPVPFPANHAGRTNDICQGCHKPAS